jgi:hypothetical protein
LAAFRNSQRYFDDIVAVLDNFVTFLRHQTCNNGLTLCFGATGQLMMRGFTHHELALFVNFTRLTSERGHLLTVDNIEIFDFSVGVNVEVDVTNDVLSPDLLTIDGLYSTGRAIFQYCNDDWDDLRANAIHYWFV